MGPLHRRLGPRGADGLAEAGVRFTYHADDVQRRVLARIASVLRPGGALVIGGHERLPGDLPGLEPWPEAACCYLYRAGAG